MLTKQGTITSAKMQNTVTVTVHRQVQHPLYKKSFRKSKKFLADTNGVEDLAVGDLVIITECRPLSKTKHFKVTDVVKRAPRVSEMANEAGVEKAIHREKKDTSHENTSHESDETRHSTLETSRSQS